VIACTQTDIKRVLAYSTMSQIGYMMFALGVSGQGGEAGLGFTGSMFHLFTHAFFKSLLFLGAGAVIHLVHSNEMKDMGGLRKLMPITHLAFLVACLAIAGIWPFSGFFSKEEILLAAYNSDKLVYGIALFTAALTAFYMFRLYFSVFWNKPAVLHDTHHGEGPVSMKLPLVILTACAVGAGFIPFSEYVTADGVPFYSALHIMFSIAPVALAAAAILLAMWMYKNANDRPARAAAGFGGVYKAATRKFYIDEVYLFITKKIVFNLIGRPAAWIDKHIVDGSMNLLAYGTGGFSEFIKGIQSGRVQSYALYFFGGAIGLAALFIYLWK
jgi:NADH-quinone oxidoreductase subunit L